MKNALRLLPGLAALLLALSSQVAPHADRADEARGKPAEASVRVRIPSTGQDLTVSWRQISGDVKAHMEPSGASAAEMHKLRVQTVLALGGQFSSGVAFRVGEEHFEAGRYALGFTVDVGEVFRFFLVDGTASRPLYFEAYEPGFEAPRLLMQILWVNRNQARLTWHLGDRAGMAKLALGR